MRNRRWGDNDRHFWPFTLSTGDYKHWGFMIDSGAHEDGRGDCHIRMYFGTVTLICELPRLIGDYSVRHVAETWDAATVERLGRNWYEERFPREFGLFVAEGTLHAHWGAQTHDSSTTKSKCYFLPWRNWRHIRRSFYDLAGHHFWTEPAGYRTAWEAVQAVEAAVPKARFEFDDYDGERIVATSHIEEYEWRMGTGWCRWLSWFRKPRIERSLKLEFSKEVGPEKGSWKGGTVGHSTEMFPDETPEAAFRRYCEKEHRSKYRKFQIKYVGPAHSAREQS